MNFGVNSNDSRTLLTQGEQVILDTNGSKLRFSASGTSVEDTIDIGAKPWAHVAIAQDGNDIGLYCDDELVGQATGTDLPAPTYDFTMQNSGDASDDVRICSGSLNAERVQTVYRQRR